MTASSTPTRVTVSSVDDLLGLVPYLLGFYPSESLVLLVLRKGQVVLTARMDLPPPDAAQLIADQLLQLSESQRASSLVLVGYGTDAAATRAVLAVAVRRLRRRGLREALYVADGRWWSELSDDCSPVEGMPFTIGSQLVAAEAVYAGLTAEPGREQIVEQVRGPGEPDREPLAQLGERQRIRLAALDGAERQREVVSTVRAFVRSPRLLGDDECVRLALLVATLDVRDAAWALMTRADADQHVNLWRQVVARTVAPWEPGPLCLLGMAAWIAGNGALQNCCSDRARRVDPAYTMTDLLEEINRRALPPTWWDRMAPEMRGLAGPLAR
jgi:hypothetical protein